VFRPFSDPVYIALALLMAAGAGALAAIPLLADPGFENALAQTVLIALLGTIWSVRCANRRFRGWLALWDEGHAPSAFDQDATSAVGGTIYLALLGGLAAYVTTCFRPACNILLGLQWHIVLPIVSALTVSGFSFVTAAIVPGRKKAGLAAAALIIGLICWSLYLFASEPVTVFYNPIFGFFPGPIYDSVVEIHDTLILSRALDLCWFAVVIIAARMLVRLRYNALSRAGWLAQNLRGVELGILAACITALTVCHHYRGELGYGIDGDYIRKALGGRAESAHFIYYYPRDSRVERELHRFMLEHEYRYQQDLEFLGITYPRKVESYIYSSPSQKKRLMGAAGTSYADINAGGMHINYEPFPHPVLKHELLHVLSGPLGMPGFGFSVNHGLTEGLAEACEYYSGDYLEHDWAWAMQELDMLPNPNRVMSTTGFFPIQGSRAYITAGSFSLWLIDRIGMPDFQKLYPWGDFEEVTGKTIQELTALWRDWLQQYPGDERILPRAEARFRRKGLFETTCGREQARLIKHGNGHLAGRRYNKAIEYYQAALDLEPDNSKALIGLARARIGLGNLEAARDAVESAMDQPGQTAMSRGRKQMLLGDILYLMEDLPAAHELWFRVYEQHLSQARDRAAYARLHCSESPAVRDLLEYLILDDPSSLKMHRLAHARRIDPADPIIAYLMGRALYNQAAYDRAEPLLVEAVQGAIPDPALARASLLLLGAARFQAKRYEDAVLAYEELKTRDLPAGLAVQVDEMIGMCIMARQHPELLLDDSVKAD